MGLNVEKLANLMRDFQIEIEEIFPSALKERAYVVGEIFKERAFAVGRHQSVPMQVSPMTVVADANVFHGAFQPVKLFHGDAQCLYSVGRRDDTTVAISLLHEMVMPFQPA